LVIGRPSLERRCLEIDPAARIANGGIACRLKRPPDRLPKDVGKAAHLGHEGQPPAPDLTDGPAPHQQALGCCGPIHPPDIDRRIVPAAIKDVGLGDPVGGQHTLGVLRIDRQVRSRSHL
jgi:hypothetical protein